MSRPTAAFFDLDKTIIAKSSTLAFSREFQAGGLISRRAMLRSAYAQFVYLVGGADHDQMEKMRQFMSQLTAGWDVATVREIVAETLHHVVDPIVYDEAVSLIEEHRELGRDVVIVSTSGAEVVGPIGAMLGADDVIATQLEIVDGKYTGTIEYYAYAEEKARAIRALADEHGRSPAQIVLRWHIQLGNIVFPKSVTPERIRENIDVFDFELSADDMAVLDGLNTGTRRGPDPDQFG